LKKLHDSASTPELNHCAANARGPRSIRAKLLIAFITIDLLLVPARQPVHFTARNALRNEALVGIEALRAARSEQISRGSATASAICKPWLPIPKWRFASRD
jgi:hypothetical protein